MTSSLILLLIDAKRQHKQHACSAVYSRVRAMHAWSTLQVLNLVDLASHA